MELLKNKNAVITGGSYGIGYGIAQSFAENGANLIIIGRDIEKLKKAKEELSQYSIEIYTLSSDLSDVNKIENLAEEILKLFPKVDILVNNAGIARFFPFADADISLLDLHLNLNVKTPYLLTLKLLPSLIKNKGNVINISSFFAHRMLQGRNSTAYSMSKGALDSFTKSLAFEIGHLGVRVNGIAPGNIETPQLKGNLANMSKQKQEEFREILKVVYPLGRIGSLEDIGKAALFLASDNANWITGTILEVDGGLTTS